MLEPNITGEENQSPLSDAIAAADKLISGRKLSRLELGLGEGQLTPFLNREHCFNRAKGVFVPPNADLAGWIKQFAKERGIGVEYIDCRTLTDYDTAHDFMTSLQAHPRTIVIIDRPDCLPESAYRQQIARILVSSWKNDNMDFTSKEGAYSVVHSKEYITIITLSRNGAYPQAWDRNANLAVVDWERPSKYL